jgi:hypothetical protein
MLAAFVTPSQETLQGDTGSENGGRTEVVSAWPPSGTKTSPVPEFIVSFILIFNIILLAY